MTFLVLAGLLFLLIVGIIIGGIICIASTDFLEVEGILVFIPAFLLGVAVIVGTVAGVCWLGDNYMPAM